MAIFNRLALCVHTLAVVYGAFTNGGFESGTSGDSPPVGWTQSAADASYSQATSASWQNTPPYSGSRYGIVHQGNRWMEQSITTTADSLYQLSFFGRCRQSYQQCYLDVLADGVTFLEYLAPTYSWAGYTAKFSASSGATVIRFLTRSETGSGSNFLDDVTYTELCPGQVGCATYYDNCTVGGVRTCAAPSAGYYATNGTVYGCTANPLCSGGLTCTGSDHEGEACASGCVSGAYDDGGNCTACEQNSMCSGTTECTGSGGAGETCPVGCVGGAYNESGVCTACTPNSECPNGLTCTGSGHAGENCTGGCNPSAFDDDGFCTPCDPNPLCSGSVTCTGAARAGENCTGACVAGAFNDSGVCTACQPNPLCSSGLSCTGTAGLGETCVGGCVLGAYDNGGRCTACDPNPLCSGGLSCTGGGGAGEACAGGCVAAAFDNGGQCTACDTNSLCELGLGCTGASHVGETCAACVQGAFSNGGVCTACPQNSLCVGVTTCTGPGGAGEHCPGGCVERYSVDVGGVCTEAAAVEDSVRFSMTVRSPEELNITLFVGVLAQQLGIHADRINVTVTDDNGFEISLDVEMKGRLEGEGGLSSVEAVTAVRIAATTGTPLGGTTPVSVTVAVIDPDGSEAPAVGLHSVSPAISVLAGGDTLELSGESFDPDCLVLVDRSAVPLSNVTYVSPSSMHVLAPPLDKEAYYADVQVISGYGSFSTLFSALYYTDDCPMEGMFGRGRDCVQCPEGAICPGGYRMWAKEGYWTPDEQAGYVVACPEPAELRCKGGRGGTLDCGPGYEDVACGSCAKGYQDYFGECVPCDGNSARRFGALLLSGILFLILFLFAALFAPDPNLTAIVEILASAQIVGTLAKLGTPHSPPYVKRIQSIYSLLLLDFEYLEPGCNLGSTGFVDVFWSNVTFAAVLFAVTEGLLLTLSFARKDHAEFYRNRMVRVVGVLLHMFYANLVVRGLESFYCVDVGDGEDLRLLHDYKIRCFTGLHLPIFLVSIVFAAYGLAFPICIFLFLLKKVTMFTEPIFYARFGYFFELYNKHDFYFTSLLVMVTLVITIASTMGKTWARFVVIVSTLGALLVLVIARRPYRQRYKNITSSAALTVPITASVYEVLLSSRVIMEDDPAGISIGYIVSILLVAFLVAIITTVLSVPVSHYLARSKHDKTIDLHGSVECAYEATVSDDDVDSIQSEKNDPPMCPSNVPLMACNGLASLAGADMQSATDGESAVSALSSRQVVLNAAYNKNAATRSISMESTQARAVSLRRGFTADDDIDFLVENLPFESDSAYSV